jgi:hypothetical protein
MHNGLLVEPTQLMLYSNASNWAGVDEIDPNSRGRLFDARKIAFLESYFGEPFMGVGATGTSNMFSKYHNVNGNGITLQSIQTGSNPNNTASVELNNLYSLIVREMDVALLAQTHIIFSISIVIVLHKIRDALIISQLSRLYFFYLQVYISRPLTGRQSMVCQFLPTFRPDGTRFRD